MILSFSELWEKCESFHKENSKDDSSIDILNEFIMKLNLFVNIASNSEISPEDIKKAKYCLFGEILFSLTAISLKENINVYEVLKIALMQGNVNHQYKNNSF